MAHVSIGSRTAARRAGAWAALAALALGTGCARPLPGACIDPVMLIPAAAAAAAGPAAPLSFEDALRAAVLESPRLSALKLGAQAAGGWPAAEPLGLHGGADSDGRPEFGVEIDLLSLLGLGPQRAERVLARLRRDAATLALEAGTREVAAELAEAFAVLAALSVVEPPPELIDVDAFVRAGLAPAASATSRDAALKSLGAQTRALEAERAAAVLRVERLLGRAPKAALALAVPAPGWPEVPEADAARLLAADPEVHRRVGAYEVARGALLRAQADRDPGLVLDPSLALDPAHFFGAVTLRLPVGAGPQIRAAAAGLEAARLNVRESVLVALEEAAASRAAWTAAEAEGDAAMARLGAAVGLAQAERARVEAQGEGFAEAVLAANAVVQASGEARSARVAAARARVRAALAAGWPAPTPTHPVPPTPPIKDAGPTAPPARRP